MSNQKITDFVDFYGIFTYKDPLIYWMVESHDSWKDRELAVRVDHFLKAYIKRLDEEIFGEKPITVPDIFGRESKDLDQEQEDPLEVDASIMTEESVSTNISEDWEKEKWSALLTKMADKARVHSYAVLQLYNKSPYWRVYCDREIIEIYYDEDGVPKGCRVEFGRNRPKSETYVYFTEELSFYDPEKNPSGAALFVPFGTPTRENDLGEYDLKDKWTLSVYMRYCNLDIVANSAKTSGFTFTQFASGADPAAAQKVVNALDLASSMRGVGASENTVRQITTVYPKKPEFTIEAQAEFIRQFAMACGLPLSYFRSESENSNAFIKLGTPDEIKINKKKMYIFSMFKPYIINLILMRWGIQIKEIEPFILETEEEEIEVKPTDRENEEKEVDIENA